MSILATNFSFPDQSDVYRGEARDVYTVGDKLVSVTTDRLSIYGHLFPQAIPHRGQVLNQLTEYFAKATEDIVPNWIEKVPDPNVIIGKKCKRFDINFVIRGALIGHAWRVYEAGAREISGVILPDGLQEFDLLEEPVITPSTKAQQGYEEDITAAQIIEQGIMSEEQFERLSIVSRQLFIRGKQMARAQGLILADTKYEFGTCKDEIYLIDEIHTPDSARYFYSDAYEGYQDNRSLMRPEYLSTEYIRQWLLEKGYSGLEGQVPPEMDDAFIDMLSKRFIDLYERLTGEEFIRQGVDIDSSERIQKNILAAI